MSSLYNCWKLLVLFALLHRASSLCKYRNSKDLPPDIFSYFASWGCYSYTRPDLFIGEPIKVTQCDVEGYIVPGVQFNKSCVPFSSHNHLIQDAVEKSFVNSEIVQRWMDCSRDAEICCRDVMIPSKNIDGHCPSVWDGWSCFDVVPGGTVYNQVCSKYAYVGRPPQCHHYSSKTCQSNGTWDEKTDYSSCDITPRLKFRTIWHITTLIVSILVCLPAITILTFCKNLRTQKLTMLRTLLIAIVTRNCLVLIVKNELIMDELTSGGDTRMSQNEWPCKLLTFFEKFAGNGVFVCMLLEGIYLHQILTNVFRSRIRGGLRLFEFYIGSFIVASGITISWAIAMVLSEDKNCWQVTEGTALHWINDAPRLTMLILNFLLLLHIVWTLWRTFHTREEHHPTIRTAKAFLICLPLFGIPFLLLMIRPDTADCDLEQLYYFSYYTVEALQGILIATLHCYAEKEIKNQFIAISCRIRRKCCAIYSKNDMTDSMEASSRRTTLNMERTTSARSSIQSKRSTHLPSSTVSSPCPSPQILGPKEKSRIPNFSQLPEIKETEERRSSVLNSRRSSRARYSEGSISCTSTVSCHSQSVWNKPLIRSNSDDTVLFTKHASDVISNVNK